MYKMEFQYVTTRYNPRNFKCANAIVDTKNIGRS